MRHFYKSLLLVVLFAVVCTAYAEDKPDIAEQKKRAGIAKEASRRGESYDTGDTAYDVNTKKYTMRHNGDEVVFSGENVPYVFKTGINGNPGETDVSGVAFEYKPHRLYGDGITNYSITRNGFRVLIKNGADFIATSYKLTEGIVDKSIKVEPVYMEYENSKCTVTADSVVLEANGKTITGDQIIFNKNRGKAIVIKDNLIEVVDFRL